MRDENAEWCAVDNFFTFDTPLGEEYCRIIDHEAIRKKQDFNSRNADYLKAVRERKVPAAYLMNAYYSRIKPCATKQEKDAARRSIAAEIEKTFPLKG